jgi:hypothetical protein
MAAPAAAATKVTDISQHLSRLCSLQGGQWGFLYSPCIPGSGSTDGGADAAGPAGSQEDGAAQLRRHTGMDMSRLAQLLATISKDAASFPGALCVVCSDRRACPGLSARGRGCHAASGLVC